MDSTILIVVTSAVFAWSLLSSRLGRADLSAPILFVAVGVLLSEGLDSVDPRVSHEVVKILAEVTLVWVLFADAARARLRELRADLRLYARLLVVGLPLTILLGLLLAMGLFTDMSIWLALLVAAALAPTDAALGAAVMCDPHVPARIRRTLNVESGLNDGIVTPVVMVAIAGVAGAASGTGGPGATLIDLAIGLGVGVVLGLVGGRAMRAARSRGWAAEDFTGPGVLALALGAYSGTLLLDGNGFVAAFVAGLAFGNTTRRGGAAEIFYVEQTAGLASLLTWLSFGAIAVPTVIEDVDWRVCVYAVLSLTVVRMVPVALALAGTGLAPATAAFIGWFGPRGLASVIFALIALEELHAEAESVMAIIGMTVLLSVLAHGLTAKPLATRYGATGVDSSPAPLADDAPSEMPVRGLLVNRSASREPPGERHA